MKPALKKLENDGRIWVAAEQEKETKPRTEKKEALSPRAEEIIAAGRVTVDGVTVTQMGVRVDATHRVTLDGKEVAPAETFEYYLLNKPAGCVTTLSDPQGRPTVISLLKGVTTRVFPVGRLDFDTEGALLLTNDGELAQKIQHPSQHTRKTYHARVKGCPSPGALRRLEQGIVLDNRRTAPASLRLLQKNRHSSLVEIILHEGRKRQVKKMLAAVDHPVVSLKRTAYGSLTLGDLPVGSFRKLTWLEVKKIF